MKEEIWEVLNALKEDVKWISLIWGRFDELFAHSDERVRLLRDVAGGFFKMIQDMTVDSAIITLSRITDVSETRYQKNITLARLISLIEAEDSREIYHEVLAINTELGELIKPLRKHRSKRIAHRDYDVARKLIELDPVIKGDIDKAVQLVQKILNVVEGHYFDQTTAYILSGNPGVVDSLIFFLEKGVETTSWND